MPVDGGQFIHSLDGALGISNVQLPDAGIYKCVASNVAGSDASEITVQVQGISVRILALARCDVTPVLSGLGFGGLCFLLLTVT